MTSQTFTVTATQTQAAFDTLRDAFAGLGPAIDSATRAFRSVVFAGYREVPVQVPRSGSRPHHVGRADWTGQRRVDSWRRRRNRRHGPPMRAVLIRTVIPRALITTGDH